MVYGLIFRAKNRLIVSMQFVIALEGRSCRERIVIFLPGYVDGLLADAGYFSEANVDGCLEEEILLFISISRDAHNQSLKERFAEPEPLSGDADSVTQMKHRLKTQVGQAVYAKRKCTVEPVFGIIKAVMGFRQFLLRGVESVRGEWNRVCLAWNLKRLHVLAA